MTVAFALLAVVLSAAALVIAVLASRRAGATDGALARHRHSHMLATAHDPVASRHSAQQGPPATVSDAEPATTELTVQRPRPGAIGRPPREEERW